MRPSRASTPWKNKIENEKKKKKRKNCATDVNTSQFIEQVFQFIFTRSSIWARCPGVRASSIRVEADDDVIQRATSHILEAPNWQPIWKILFTSCRRASDTMRFFGFFRSKRNWLFDLFITLFYWFLEMRVLSALNMMNVSSASWCMCNEPWACHECKFVTASTWFRWRLKNSNFIFRQRRRAHAWKIRTHIHAYWFIRRLLSALCSVRCSSRIFARYLTTEILFERRTLRWQFRRNIQFWFRWQEVRTSMEYTQCQLKWIGFVRSCGFATTFRPNETISF